MFVALRGVIDEAVKRRIFLHESGQESLLESLVSGRDIENEPYDVLRRALSEKIKPKVLVLSERFRLLGMRQQPNQSLADFYATLQNAAKTCEPKDVKDPRSVYVTMAFLSGIASDETIRRLLETAETPSADLLEKAEACEHANKVCNE